MLSARLHCARATAGLGVVGVAADVAVRLDVDVRSREAPPRRGSWGIEARGRPPLCRSGICAGTATLAALGANGSPFIPLLAAVAMPAGTGIITSRTASRLVRKSWA